MPTFSVRAFTGPSWVHQYADKCREAGLTVTTEGTEHVYVTCDGQTPEGAAWNAGVEVRKKHGERFWMQFKPVVQWG